MEKLVPTKRLIYGRFTMQIIAQLAARCKSMRKAWQIVRLLLSLSESQDTFSFEEENGLLKSNALGELDLYKTNLENIAQ